MRSILFAAAFAIAACSQPAPAEPVEDAAQVEAQDPAEFLAEQIRHAIAVHDPQIILNLTKWDGVRDEQREIFGNFVAIMVELDIQSVVVEPPGFGSEPFEHQGVIYAKNGQADGQVTIAFPVEPPTVSEYLHWQYAVENGRAVILVDAPVNEPMIRKTES